MTVVGFAELGVALLEALDRVLRKTGVEVDSSDASLVLVADAATRANVALTLLGTALVASRLGEAEAAELPGSAGLICTLPSGSARISPSSSFMLSGDARLANVLLLPSSDAKYCLVSRCDSSSLSSPYPSSS